MFRAPAHLVLLSGRPLQSWAFNPDKQAHAGNVM